MGAYLRTSSAEISADRDRIYAEFPRLADRKRQAAGTLSGGEQQMLAIGRALMSRPRLIMFDEPSLGLAPNIVERTFAIIRGIRDAGTTVLLVEQNAFAALEMCDHAYLLEGGRIVLSGTGCGDDRERARAEGLSWRMSGAKRWRQATKMDAGLWPQPADFAHDRLRPGDRRRFDPGLERRSRRGLRADLPARTG